MTTSASNVRPPRPGWTTARDVARLAGVSAMTVSNVLNHPTRVTPETAARVAEAVVALDFHPLDAARRVRAVRSRVLGVVVGDLRDPLQASAARAISELAAARGLLALLADSRRSADHEGRHVRAFRQQNARAILVLPVDGSRQEARDADPVPIRVVTPRMRAVEVASELLDASAAGAT